MFTRACNTITNSSSLGMEWEVGTRFWMGCGIIIISSSSSAEGCKMEVVREGNASML